MVSPGVPRVGPPTARSQPPTHSFQRRSDPPPPLTPPPHAQFVCLGPARAERVVAAICARTGVEAAVVDVNDRSREIGLTVVAASAGVDVPRLTAALLDNPAGNAAQQTPLVIVRGAAAGAMR